jgi:hypothetical protein
MASPATLYFAGIATVVGAISFGFAGAMVLVNTQTIAKQPAAGFEKRHQPVEEQFAGPARAPETTGQAPAGSSASTRAKEVKEVEIVGQFAPPKPQALEPPTPAVPETGTVERARRSAPVKPASDGGKPEPKMNREFRKRTAIAQKKATVRKQYAERRKKQIEVADEDGRPMRTTSFDSERHEPLRSGEGFFNFR